jgi:hypothetical protein
MDSTKQSSAAFSPCSSAGCWVVSKGRWRPGWASPLHAAVRGGAGRGAGGDYGRALAVRPPGLPAKETSRWSKKPSRMWAAPSGWKGTFELPLRLAPRRMSLRPASSLNQGPSWCKAKKVALHLITSGRGAEPFSRPARPWVDQSAALRAACRCWRSGCGGSPERRCGWRA